MFTMFPTFCFVASSRISEILDWRRDRNVASLWLPCCTVLIIYWLLNSAVFLLNAAEVHEQWSCELIGCHIIYVMLPKTCPVVYPGFFIGISAPDGTNWGLHYRTLRPGAIFGDLEWPYMISRSHHSSALHMSEMVRDT